MQKQIIIGNLTKLIGKANAPSDFAIATTMVRHADLDNSSKIKLHTFIAQKKIQKGHWQKPFYLSELFKLKINVSKNHDNRPISPSRFCRSTRILPRLQSLAWQATGTNLATDGGTFSFTQSGQRANLRQPRGSTLSLEWLQSKDILTLTIGSRLGGTPSYLINSAQECKHIVSLVNRQKNVGQKWWISTRAKSITAN